MQHFKFNLRYDVFYFIVFNIMLNINNYNQKLCLNFMNSIEYIKGSLRFKLN